VRRNLIIRLSRSACSAFFSGLEVIHETATILSEATGELVGNISRYLKVLAAAGVIEEVPELAKNRRERWWRTAKASHDGALDPGRLLDREFDHIDTESARRTRQPDR
jgi:hypothetical protein